MFARSAAPELMKRQILRTDSSCCPRLLSTSTVCMTRGRTRPSTAICARVLVSQILELMRYWIDIKLFLESQGHRPVQSVAQHPPWFSAVWLAAGGGPAREPGSALAGHLEASLASYIAGRDRIRRSGSRILSSRSSGALSAVRQSSITTADGIWSPEPVCRCRIEAQC